MQWGAAWGFSGDFYSNPIPAIPIMSWEPPTISTPKLNIASNNIGKTTAELGVLVQAAQAQAMAQQAQAMAQQAQAQQAHAPLSPSDEESVQAFLESIGIF